MEGPQVHSVGVNFGTLKEGLAEQHLLGSFLERSAEARGRLPIAHLIANDTETNYVDVEVALGSK